MKEQVQIAVHLTNGKTYKSRLLDFDEETTQETIELIKQFKNHSTFWMIDSKNNIVSFNPDHIVCAQVNQVKQFKLF